MSDYFSRVESTSGYPELPLHLRCRTLAQLYPGEVVYPGVDRLAWGSDKYLYVDTGDYLGAADINPEELAGRYAVMAVVDYETQTDGFVVDLTFVDAVDIQYSPYLGKNAQPINSGRPDIDYALTQKMKAWKPVLGIICSPYSPTPQENEAEEAEEDEQPEYSGPEYVGDPRFEDQAQELSIIVMTRICQEGADGEQTKDNPEEPVEQTEAKAVHSQKMSDTNANDSK